MFAYPFSYVECDVGDEVEGGGGAAAAAAVLARENNLRAVLSSAWISIPTVSSQSFGLLVIDVSDDDEGDDTSSSVASGCDIETEGREDGNEIGSELSVSEVGSAACSELLQNCCTLPL